MGWIWTGPRGYGEQAPPRTPECRKNMAVPFDLISDGMTQCGLCELPVCDDLCQVGLNHNVECKVFRNFRGSNFVKEDNGTLAVEVVLPLRLLQVIYCVARSYTNI